MSFYDSNKECREYKIDRYEQIYNHLHSKEMKENLTSMYFYQNIPEENFSYIEECEYCYKTHQKLNIKQRKLLAPDLLGCKTNGQAVCIRNMEIVSIRDYTVLCDNCYNFLKPIHAIQIELEMNKHVINKLNKVIKNEENKNIRRIKRDFT